MSATDKDKQISTNQLSSEKPCLSPLKSPSNGNVVRPRRLLPSPKRKRAPLPPNLFVQDIEEIKLSLNSDEEQNLEQDSSSCPHRYATVLDEELHFPRSCSSPAILKTDGLSPRQRAYALSSETDVGSDWVLLKPIKLWSKHDVDAWLCRVGLPNLLKYLPDLEGSDLERYVSQGLKNLDIKDNELQDKFIVELKRLKSHDYHNQEKDITHATETQSFVAECGELNSPSRGERRAGSLSKKPKVVEEELSNDLNSAPREGKPAMMSSKNATVYHNDQVRLWTNGMVLQWLDSVGLDKFKPMFKAKTITGDQLLNIDMKLLDDMHISTTTEREEILSHIYQLINTDNGLNNNIQRSNSGCSLVKVMPLTRSSSANSTPPLTPSPRTPPVIDKSGFGKQDSGKKKKGGLSKLKEKMAPKIFGTRNKDPMPTTDCVHVWNSLNSHESMTMTPVKATESTTCTDVVHTLLEQNGITDDFNLYCMVESPVDPEQEILDREMGKFECPLFVEHQWSHPPACRLELHKRRGSQIKVVYHITGMRQRGKSFSVSYTSTSTDVLKAALRKIRLRQVDEALFCLMEINKANGDITPVEDNDIILNLASDCFVLCDRVNRDQLCEDKTVTEDVASVVRRNSSLMSHGSTLSGNSFESSTSLTSSGSDNLKPRTEKLEHLEAEMATIEVSIKGVTPVTPGDNTTHGNIWNNNNLPQEGDVIKDNHVVPHADKSTGDEKDSIIEKLQQDFQALVSQTKELEGCQRQLTQTENLLKERETDWQCKLDCLKTQLELSRNHSSWDVLQLQMDIENAKCEVEAKTRLVEKLRNDMQMDKNSVMDHSEREYQLHSHESSLVRIRQKLDSLQQELDVAIQRQQNSPVSLSCMVGADDMMSMCLLVLPSSEGITLKCGCHGETVVMEVPDDSVLKPGDRILEVDEKNAMVLTQNEIDSLLRMAEETKVLVLRDIQPISDSDRDNVNNLKDDLSLALVELEAAQRDNTNLLQENDKILKRNEKYEKDHGILKDQVGSLTKKLKQWEDRWRDLRSTLLDMKSDDIDSTMIISPTKTHMKTRIKDHELSQMKNMLTQNASHIGRLQQSLRAKELALQVISKERAEALATLQKQENSALSYEELETDVPLWVSLKKAPKESVLQALKDNVVQNTRQKAYLDRLLAVVIEQAPHLLDSIETEELDQVIDGSTQDAAWC